MLQKIWTKWMMGNLVAKMKDEEGQGLAEYALILVLVALAVITALTGLGTTIAGVFDSIVANL